MHGGLIYQIKLKFILISITHYNYEYLQQFFTLCKNVWPSTYFLHIFIFWSTSLEII
jgi:hypothetical protein